MGKAAIIKPNKTPLFYECLKILWENEIIPPPKTAGQYTLRTDLAIDRIGAFEKMLTPLLPDELKTFIFEESFGLSDAIKAKYDLVELDNYLEKIIKKYQPNSIAGREVLSGAGAGKGDKKTPPPTRTKTELVIPESATPETAQDDEIESSGDATGNATSRKPTRIDDAILHGRNSFANDFICDIGVRTPNPFIGGDSIFLISAWNAGYIDSEAKCKNKILRESGQGQPESEEEKTGAMIVGMAGGSPIDQ